MLVCIRVSLSGAIPHVVDQRNPRPRSQAPGDKWQIDAVPRALV